MKNPLEIIKNCTIPAGQLLPTYLVRYLLIPGLGGGWKDDPQNSLTKNFLTGRGAISKKNGWYFSKQFDTPYIVSGEGVASLVS